MIRPENRVRLKSNRPAAINSLIGINQNKTAAVIALKFCLESSLLNKVKSASLLVAVYTQSKMSNAQITFRLKR